MDREQRIDVHRTSTVRCSRTMKNTNLDNPTVCAWLVAVEALAVRLDDAQLALAALRMRHHSNISRIVACVLTELSRRASERTSDAEQVAERTSLLVVNEGRELAGLIARGWDVFETVQGGGL